LQKIQIIVICAVSVMRNKGAILKIKAQFWDTRSSIRYHFSCITPILALYQPPTTLLSYCRNWNGHCIP